MAIKMQLPVNCRGKRVNVF